MAVARDDLAEASFRSAGPCWQLSAERVKARQRRLLAVVDGLAQAAPEIRVVEGVAARRCDRCRVEAARATQERRRGDEAARGGGRRARPRPWRRRRPLQAVCGRRISRADAAPDA